MHVYIMSAACAFAIAGLYYNQPLLPLIGTSFGTTGSTTSLLVTLGQLGYALGLLLFVPIGDRFDRRYLIVALLAANTVSLAACSFAPTFQAFALATFVAGVTTVTPQIIIPTVAGNATPAERGRVVGILLSGMSAGLLAGRTLSGLLGQWAGWRTVFLAAIAINLLLIPIVWRFLPLNTPKSALPYFGLLRSLWQLLTSHSVLRDACATGFLAFCGFGAVWATLAPLLAQAPYNLGSDIAGLFGLVAVVTIFAGPILGRLTDRFGTRLMIAAGFSILMAAFVLVSLTLHALWFLILGVVLIDIGYRSVLIANQTRIYPLQKDAQTRLNTLIVTFAFLGGAAGSACGAIAATHGGWSGVALVGGGFAMLGLAYHLRRRR